MKNKCTKCDKELDSKYDWGLCYDCNKKKKKLEKRDAVIFFSIIIIFAVGMRIIWAKAVYKDSRCAFAECRIQVNP